ncbi:carbohydrate ABC transporter membrane protein 1 (CUT1 family) [Scopulibacillus darangshiensis]|uniref:Carbohydrate ABC transporter membrane protein 1 (CUT1 family) n=1 Tax=Scopulibacillus darangshiensis TaxID=442528 RepID=A0A4R2NHX0_9BACL|nr:sugar ABC transporter permease [Scopulibacillus darangshiensis]TCP20775.1 carbohydrate ABC transporter membrane protein 1 (CUT1 family) [Scopulibacillus darangshiensis]
MTSHRKWLPFVYLAPVLVILVLFVYYPIFSNVYYSFFDWGSFSNTMHFTGLSNFINLFKDSVFFTALKNNIYYAIISEIILVGGGLVLAAILEDKLVRRYATFLRTIYFLPVLISITVIALLFEFFYNPQTGLLNKLLESIGLDGLTRAWLGNGDTAIFAVIAMSQWQSLGYVAMLFIISIQKIPSELYEAARIDGAGKVKQFFHITVPQVKEMAFVATIMTLTQAFTVFNEPYILTGGGPGHSSEVLTTYLYHSAFNEDAMGYASAIATVILAITLIISVVQLKVFRSGEGD